MSWITIIWSMTVSACLMMATTHLLVWWNNRTEWASLAFAVTALGIAGTGAAEFLVMHASTPAEFAAVLRWAYVPVSVMGAGIVWFVYVDFRTARPWLAWLAVALRFLTLIPNFTTGQTVVHQAITSLRQVEFLGEAVSVVASAVPGRWIFLPVLSNLVFMAFVADASVRLWRSGGHENRGRAVRVGGSILGFIFVGAGFTALINYQVVHAPYFVSIPFFPMILAMDYELSLDVLRAHRLIRELQVSESHLRESERRLSLAADAADLGLWSLNTRGNTFWATDEARRIFGLAPETRITIEMLQAMLHAEDRPSVEAGVAAAIGGRAGYQGEFRIVRPDGQVRWIAVRGEKAGGDGDVTSITGVVMDITERRQSELEIAQQRSQLAHLSRVGTVSELSGSLAHELNQPLAIILTNAQAAQRLLAQQPPDLAEARDILADIVSEDQRAGEVIRRLRSLLKHGESSMQSLTVNELVDEVLRLVRNDLIGQGVTIHPNLTADIPRVIGDPIQLEQVLLNLILNASDAMATNSFEGRHLMIATAHRNGVVRVSVSDTGCGLPADATRIFEPFYTTKKQGLGLGLAICRSIIEAHKGRLWAEAREPADSTSGATASASGTTFHLELPAAAEDA